MAGDQEALTSEVNQTQGVVGDPIKVHQVGFQPHESQQVFFLPRVYVENWLPFSYVPYYLPCPEIL